MLVLSGVALAQNQLTFSVTSAFHNKPVDYAEVLISKTDTFRGQHVIAARTTNEFGTTNFNLPSGEYYALVTSVGYVDQKRKINLTGSKLIELVLQTNHEVLSQTVVTVQHRSQSASKSVEKVLVIDKRDLENRSVFNLKDALEQQMNIQISNDASTGSSASLMGVSGQNVKILIDGVPVIGRLDGNLDLSQINLNDIERIEVIEGPVSTSYGTNALAGVINIITKKKTSSKGEIGLQGYHETNGQDNLSINAGKRFGKANVRVAGGRNFFAGWNPTDEGRYDQWKPKEQYFGRAQVGWTNKKNQFLVKSELFRELLLNKGKPLPSYYETAFDEEFRTTRLDQKVQWSRQIDTNKSFQMYVAYNDYKRVRNKFFRDLVTLESKPVLNDGGNDTTGFTAVMSRGTYSYFKPGGRYSYQLGYDLIHQQGVGARIADKQQLIYDLAAFATLEYQLWPGLIVKPGARIAYNSSYKAPVAPTVSARYKRKKYVYRFSYGRGFRAPDIKELYLYFVDVNHNVVGNENLQAERSHNFQFSTTSTHKVKKFFVRPTLSVFYNQIYDKITLAGITATEYTYINLDEFGSLGGNLKLELAGEKIRVNLGVSSTHVTSISNTESGDESKFSYQEVMANVSRSFGKTKVNVYTKYNGPKSVFNVNTENDEITESRIEDYMLMDVQLGRDLLKGKFQLNIGSKNVLNVTNINNQLQSSGGAHTSGGSTLAIGTGRSYFVRGVLKLTK